MHSQADRYTLPAVGRHSVYAGGHSLGNTELLPKPFTPSTLARRVREVLDRAGTLSAPT